MSKEGETGRRKINQYSRYGTVVLAVIQGWLPFKACFSGNQLKRSFRPAVFYTTR